MCEPEQSLPGWFQRNFDALRSLASSELARERCGHTLQTTAVVHEVFLRLHEVNGWNNTDHFLCVAKRSMRRLLIDHAKKKKAQKRGNGATRLDLFESETASPKTTPRLPLEDVEVALTYLKGQSAESAQNAEVVELRLLRGLTLEATVEATGISMSQVRTREKRGLEQLRKLIDRPHALLEARLANFLNSATRSDDPSLWIALHRLELADPNCADAIRRVCGARGSEPDVAERTGQTPARIRKLVSRGLIELERLLERTT